MTSSSLGTGAYAWKVGRGESRLLAHMSRQ